MKTIKDIPRPFFEIYYFMSYIKRFLKSKVDGIENA